MEKTDKKSGENKLGYLNNVPGSFAAFEVVYDARKEPSDLRFITANEPYLASIDMTLEEAYGKLFSELVERDKAWISFYIEVALGGESQITETYSEDLGMYLNIITYSPCYGTVVAVILDRTKAVMAERVFKEREKDFALLFASLESGICIGKIINDEDGEPVDIYFQMVNESYELMEGARVGSLQGEKLYEKYPDADKTYFPKYVETAYNRRKHTFIKSIPLLGSVLEVVCYSPSEGYFICIENDVTKRVKAEKKLEEAYAKIEMQNKTILEGIDYASRIQQNLLTESSVFENNFSDYSIIWKPRDVVGGDIYWMKEFEEGSVLCVCDCTGHGTPGALLTMLVVSAFDHIVSKENYNDTADIIWQLERELVKVFQVDTSKTKGTSGDIVDIKDGCDLAVLYVTKEGTVTISAANTSVFVCDGTEVTRLKGQKLFIGEGKLKCKEDIEVNTIQANKKNKFYVGSDGLYDQLGEEMNLPFGYQTFEKIILENHNEKQSVISNLIWNAFEEHQGTQERRDDFELISFRP